MVSFPYSLSHRDGGPSVSPWNTSTYIDEISNILNQRPRSTQTLEKLAELLFKILRDHSIEEEELFLLIEELYDEIKDLFPKKWPEWITSLTNENSPLLSFNENILDKWAMNTYFFVIRRGDDEVLKKLLSSHIKPKPHWRNGTDTLLFSAIWRNQAKCAKLLIEAAKDPRDYILNQNNHENPVSLAFSLAHTDILEVFKYFGIGLQDMPEWDREGIKLSETPRVSTPIMHFMSTS